MKVKKFFMIFISLVLLVLIFILIKIGKNIFIGNASGYNNEIFTKNICDQLITINCWYGDTKIVINKDIDIKSIYNKLAALNLKKASPNEPRKEGSIRIELVMNNETIAFGLLSNIVYINNEMYFTNNDVLSLIREIADKYKDKD
jgi:hypothetical protein